MIGEVEDKVYTKFDIYNRTEFENFTNKLSLKDKDIAKIMNDIRHSYLKSLNGEPERYEINFPTALTKELVLETKKKIVKAEMNNFMQYCI